MIFLIYHQAWNQVHNKIQQAPDCELQLEGKQVSPAQLLGPGRCKACRCPHARSFRVANLEVPTKIRRKTSI